MLITNPPVYCRHKQNYISDYILACIFADVIIVTMLKCMMKYQLRNLCVFLLRRTVTDFKKNKFYYNTELAGTVYSQYREAETIFNYLPK